MPILGTSACGSGLSNTGVSNGDLTAAGTIKGSTVTGTTGGFLFLNGTIVHASALTADGATVTDLTATTGIIETLGAKTGTIESLGAKTGTIESLDAGTLKTAGKATLDSLEVANNATVKGDLTVDGTVTLNGGLVLNGGSITAAGGNFETLSTTGLATLNSLEVANDAEVKGNLKVGGNLDMTGGDITNVGDITASGKIKADTIETTGNATVGSLNVRQNARIAGTLDVGGDLNVGTLLSTNVVTNVVAIHGTLDMAGGNITSVGHITAGVGTFTSVTTTGLAVSGNTVLGNSPADVVTVNASSTFNAPVTVNASSTFNAPVTVAKGATVSESFTVTPGSTISMGGNRVRDVAAPVLDTDAANKGYVDAGLARAFNEIDRNTQGIAIAMAMSGLTLPDGKNFALGANLGFFDSKQAIAVQGAIRINPSLTLTGGIGTGVQDLDTLGGRVGIQAAW